MTSKPHELVELSKLKALVNEWQADVETVSEERAALKRADDILRDGTLRHSIELWDMKCIQIQRCALRLQTLMLEHVEVMANAELSRVAASEVNHDD